jgi:hypothetical protein
MLGGIELLDGSPELGQVRADAGIAVDCLDRAIEEAVRSAGGFRDLLAAHGGELIDLLAEVRAVRIQAGKFVDELRNALVELADLFRLQWNEPGRVGRGDRLKRLGRVKLELGVGPGLGCRFSRHISLEFSIGRLRRAKQPEQAAPRAQGT